MHFPSENPTDPASTTTSSAEASTTLTSGKSADDRGRDSLKPPTKSVAEERELSPGSLPDGTHVQTSGDRGETYEPGKFSKLKGKLNFGKH